MIARFCICRQPHCHSITARPLSTVTRKAANLHRSTQEAHFGRAVPCIMHVGHAYMFMYVSNVHVHVCVASILHTGMRMHMTCTLTCTHDNVCITAPLPTVSQDYSIRFSIVKGAVVDTTTTHHSQFTFHAFHVSHFTLHTTSHSHGSHQAPGHGMHTCARRTSYEYEYTFI